MKAHFLCRLARMVVRRYKERVYIESNADLKRKLSSVVHAFAVSGHIGIQNPFRRIKGMFYWPQLKHIVKHEIMLSSLLNDR